MNIEKIKSNLHESLQLFEKAGYYWICENEYFLSVDAIKFNSDYIKYSSSLKSSHPIKIEKDEKGNMLPFIIGGKEISPEDLIIFLQKTLIA